MKYIKIKFKPEDFKDFCYASWEKQHSCPLCKALKRHFNANNVMVTEHGCRVAGNDFFFKRGDFHFETAQWYNIFTKLLSKIGISTYIKIQEHEKEKQISKFQTV